MPVPVAGSERAYAPFLTSPCPSSGGETNTLNESYHLASLDRCKHRLECLCLNYLTSKKGKHYMSTRLGIGLGCVISMALGLVLPAAAEEFAWHTDQEAGVSKLTFGDKLVLKYMFAYDPSTKDSLHDTYKVYHHVYGPGSGELITKGPGGLYTHHRGMYVGWNKTQVEGGKTYDFWHCKDGAHLLHVAFVEQVATADRASMTSEIHWNSAAGDPIVRELRTVTVHPEPGMQAYRIDWSSKLESKAGNLTLTGDRQHAGFQFRAAQEVAETNGARFIRPANAPQAAEAIQVGDAGDPPAHINFEWFAQTFEVGGKRYTVEYFDNPQLPKPSLFSERPYGRFGTFFTTKLGSDQPLHLQYRLIVSEGDAPAVKEIQSRYDAFVKDLANQ